MCRFLLVGDSDSCAFPSPLTAVTCTWSAFCVHRANEGSLAVALAIGSSNTGFMLATKAAEALSCSVTPPKVSRKQATQYLQNDKSYPI